MRSWAHPRADDGHATHSRGLYRSRMTVLTKKQHVVAEAKRWPSVADVALYDFDELRRICTRAEADVSKRDEFADIGRALKHTARLLWGERITEPIRYGSVAHRRQVLVLVYAIDRLLH